MSGYQQVRLAELQQLLANRVESVPWWTPEDARRAINESLRIWNAATGFWKQPFTQVTVPDDPYVAAPGSLVQSTRVRWNGVPLEKASLADFDYGIPNWRGTTTQTAGAPTQPQYWAPVSLSLLAIYPADATALNSLLIDGVRATPVLAAPTDWLDLGQEELDTLLGYALHVLAFKVGGQTLVNTYPGWLGFLRAAGERNHQFAASAFYRQALGLNQLRRMFPSSRPVPGLIDVLGHQAQQAGIGAQDPDQAGGGGGA